MFKNIIDKNSPTGKGVRTTVQAFVGVTTWLLGLLAVPGVAEYLADNELFTITSLAVWIGVMTYLQNTAERVLED